MGSDVGFEPAAAGHGIVIAREVAQLALFAAEALLSS